MRWFYFLPLLPLAINAAEPLPGHSFHGESFNEGPRQAAVLMEGCGKVKFPVATNNPDAQKFFNQGVGQLHGFWYFEAERSFRQVAMLDPDCAMAYWGCAMANINNAKRAKGFIKKAAEKKSKASPKEKAWITALENFHADDKKEKKVRQMDFIRETEDIVSDHPDDIEAKAFLAWAIWHSKEDGVPMVSRETVDALLKQVFAKEPMHPAHHYVIHLWDDSKPARAVASATQCGQTSPGIAHMWHMPGHTFSKVKRLADAAWQQEAATRVDHAYMIRTQILPDQIHNYAHNTEWLIRTLDQIGQPQKAASIAKTLIEIPRHSTWNTVEGKGDDKSKSASFGRTRLLESLSKFGMWDEILALEDSPWLDVTENPAFEAVRLRSLGVAACFKNDKDALGKHIKALTALEAKPSEENMESKPKRKDASAEKDKGKSGKKKGDAAVKNALAELEALRTLLESKPDEAAKLLAKASDIPKDRLVRYQLQMGDKEKAVKTALQLPKDAAGLALQADVLMLCEKNDEARKSIENLRDSEVVMDENLPMSKRLNEIAAQLGINGPWIRPPVERPDTGVRPDMATLGPLAWHPWRAASFTLPDQTGRERSLKDFNERPLIILFYLGHTCGHCMEQLKAFAATKADFEKAGIGILAIGSEPVGELAATGSACGGGADAPFPLLADSSLGVFKQWRCYDDFEGMGLHGVFLLDENGQVRWADVGSDPFTNTRFLLQEAKRLLKFKTESTAP